MSLEVVFRQRLDGDEAAGWDRVAAPYGLFATSRMLGISRGISPDFLEVLDPVTGPLAVAPCYTADALGSLPEPADPYQQYLLTFRGWSDVSPVMVIGPIRGYSTRLLVAPEGNAVRAEVLRALERGVLELGRRRGARLLSFSGLPQDDVAELRAIDPALVPVFSFSEAILRVPADFPVYLRNGSRGAEWRNFARAGLKIEVHRLLDVLDQVAPLNAEHGRRFGELDEVAAHRARLHNLAIAFGPEARVICAVRDGVMLGAHFFITQDGHYYSRTIGLKRGTEVPRKAGLYFNLGFYALIELAIRENISEIHCSVTAVAPKVSRGCRLQSLWSALRWLDDGENLLPHLRTVSLRRIEAERLELQKASLFRDQAQEELERAMLFVSVQA